MPVGGAPEEPDLSEFRYVGESTNLLGFSTELAGRLEKAKTVKDLLGLYYDADVSKMELSVKANFQEAIALKFSERDGGELVSATFFQIANETRNTRLVLDSNNSK